MTQLQKAFKSVTEVLIFQTEVTSCISLTLIFLLFENIHAPNIAQFINKIVTNAANPSQSVLPVVSACHVRATRKSVRVIFTMPRKCRKQNSEKRTSVSDIYSMSGFMLHLLNILLIELK